MRTLPLADTDGAELRPSGRQHRSPRAPSRLLPRLAEAQGVPAVRVTNAAELVVELERASMRHLANISIEAVMTLTIDTTNIVASSCARVGTG